MFKTLAQRIARYVLRNELVILNEDIQIANDRFFKLNDEYECFCFDAQSNYIELRQENDELRKELHAADRDNAFLYEQLKELHAENNGLRIDLDNGSNFTNELMAELRELRGVKEFRDLCDLPF